MMNKILQDIQKMREHFGWDKTDTKAFMTKALLEEAQELYDALNEDDQAYQDELADVFMYALSIVMDSGYDLESMIKSKIETVMQREY